MFITNQPTSRLGLHYFPDSLHYREQDLQIWLPELQELGIGWLTLFAPTNRAIPEEFIQGLLVAGIQPVLQFPLQLDIETLNLQLNILFSNYARWGIQYVALFDRPNIRHSWPSAGWVQTDLVERFLDFFIPLAETAIQAGLKPVFPPLEPGGDYWDTAFLQSALRSLQRRGKTRLAQSMALGAYAWTYNRPLNWGAGGPECWPVTQPYYTPAESQDQIGFRIFDWYQTVALAEIGRPLPILLLRAGSRPGDNLDTSQNLDLRKHAEENMAIAQLFSQVGKDTSNKLSNDGGAVNLHSNQPNRISFESDENQSIEPGLGEIVCVNYWLLSASFTSPEIDDAWYKPDGTMLPIVNAMKQWSRKLKDANASTVNKSITSDPFSNPTYGTNQNHPIDHYLLLPIYAWGVADCDFEAIKPYLQKFHPTIGFSAYEARLANRVTIFGETTYISDETLAELHTAGCQVERINRDGILLAL